MILLKEILEDLYFEPLGESTPPIADYGDYIKSMNKGMASKTWFLDKIQPDCILDFGCADGSILKYIHEKFPDISLIGYDIDAGMEARFKQNNPDIPFTSNYKEAVKMAKKYPKNCILLSSVIHEVYSYSPTKGHGISKFWDQLFGSGFKYIVIRDTIPDKIDIVAPKDFSDDVDKVIDKLKSSEDGLKYLLDFEQKLYNNKQTDIQPDPNDVGKVVRSKYRFFVRFILTYRYKSNWDRESLENYMPLSYSTLLRKIPSAYKIIEGDNYTFEPLAANFQTEYGIQLKVNTHLNMILSR